MDRPAFATRLDSALTNPLLRGLDIAYVRTVPEDEHWWSPETRRTLEIYLYPGPFGSDRLPYLNERARRTVEQTAASLVGAHEARLLAAPPVPLKLGEWLIEVGYATMLLGPVPFVDSSPSNFAATVLLGATAILTGRGLHAWMWRQLSRPPRRPSSRRALASTPL